MGRVSPLYPTIPGETILTRTSKGSPPNAPRLPGRRRNWRTRAEAELAEVPGSVGVDVVRTLNPKHRPTLLTHRKRHPGRQPNVVPTDREHAEYYLSDFCKQPVVKYNPPSHQYLPEGSVSRGVCCRVQTPRRHTDRTPGFHPGL
jgi:hypothetical protein